MGAGFTYRMGRIFRGPDGRAVIVPVDDGLQMKMLSRISTVHVGVPARDALQTEMAATS